MPADSCGPDNTDARPSILSRRRSERRPCSLRVNLQTTHGNAYATLTDVSAEGAGFSLDRFVVLRPGERLVISHDRLGSCPCHVRWAAPPRYGVEFAAGTRTPAALMAFYDSLPPAAGQVV